MEKASFVFIDEFDAFYHYELSESVQKRLRRITGVQVFTTAHNTDLMSNDLLRPDCYFLLENNSIKAFQSGTHKVVENQSLLPYLCLILGDRLPKEYRKNMIDKLKCGRFITDHGFATESLDSNCYRPDGYWRGPIWAPSTVILCDGLSKCGEIDLAKETARKFLEMAKQSGFAENYNAVTGEGLRDRAYTWTSSGVFILAEEYLNSRA